MNLRYKIFRQSSQESLRRNKRRFTPARNQLLIAFSEKRRGNNVTNNIKHVFHLMKERSRKAESEKLTRNFVMISLFHFCSPLQSFSVSWFCFIFFPSILLTCCCCWPLCKSRIIWFFRVFSLFHPRVYFHRTERNLDKNENFLFSDSHA